MFKKTLLLASAIGVAATGVVAGTVAYVAPAAPVMVEEPAMGGSGMWLIPLIAIALIALAVSRDTQPILISDRRLKRDIKRTGTAENGLALYEFKYIWGRKTHVGVMAQDVLLHTPKAVVRSIFGFYKVNYRLLGLEMTTVS